MNSPADTSTEGQANINAASGDVLPTITPVAQAVPATSIEGVAERKAPKQKAPKQKAPEPPVIFESAERESHQFSICGINPSRNQSGHKLVYEVPADILDRFERHHHIKSGRVRRKK